MYLSWSNDIVQMPAMPAPTPQTPPLCACMLSFPSQHPISLSKGVFGSQHLLCPLCLCTWQVRNVRGLILIHQFHPVINTSPFGEIIPSWMFYTDCQKSQTDEAPATQGSNLILLILLMANLICLGYYNQI